MRRRYKKNYTVKFLVGITASGAITFVSEACVKRAGALSPNGVWFLDFVSFAARTHHRAALVRAPRGVRTVWCSEAKLITT